MKISKQKLLEKLLQIDERLVNIWIQDDLELADEEIWDLFVVLLETRVELLKTCRQAGIPVSQEMALPEWLETLVTSRNEIRLREIKQLARDLKRRRQVLSYKSALEAADKLSSRRPGEDNLDESV